MAHTFSATWERRDILDPDTQEYITHQWLISFELHNSFLDTCSNYVAEAAQLPEEPTLADVEALILGLYGPGYDAISPETV